MVSTSIRLCVINFVHLRFRIILLLTGKGEFGMETDDGLEITVRLMGKAAEFLTPDVARRGHLHDIKVRLPNQVRETTPAEIIRFVAEQNPLLRDQIIRGDGTPRSSTRILINGVPPKSLSEKIEVLEEFVDEPLLLPKVAGPPVAQPHARRRVIVLRIHGEIGPFSIDIVIVVPCDG